MGKQSGNEAALRLTPQQRSDWNEFSDWLATKNLKGSATLDADKNVGVGLIQQYQQEKPNTSVTPQMIADFQQEIANYRAQALNEIHTGKAISEIKSDDEFMPGLSKVDGWLGSKTSAFKFPKQIFNTYKNGKIDSKDYGTDYEGRASELTQSASSASLVPKN